MKVWLNIKSLCSPSNYQLLDLYDNVNGLSVHQTGHYSTTMRNSVFSESYIHNNM